MPDDKHRLWCSRPILGHPNLQHKPVLDVLFATGEEIIHYSDLVALVHQHINKM